MAGQQVYSSKCCFKAHEDTLAVTSQDSRHQKRRRFAREPKPAFFKRTPTYECLSNCTECSRSKAEQRRTPASHRIQERRKPMPCAAMNHFPTYPRRSGGIVFVITLVLSGLVDPIVGEPSMPGRRVFLPVPAPPGYIPGKPSSAPADRQSESLSLPLCGSGCLPRFWTFRPILGAPATAL